MYNLKVSLRLRTITFIYSQCTIDCAMGVLILYNHLFLRWMPRCSKWYGNGWWVTENDWKMTGQARLWKVLKFGQNAIAILKVKLNISGLPFHSSKIFGIFSISFPKIFGVGFSTFYTQELAIIDKKKRSPKNFDIKENRLLTFPNGNMVTLCPHSFDKKHR